MEFKYVPIESLRRNPKNRNKHSEEQIKRLAELIVYQGWRHPIVVSNRSGLVAAGHGRLEAARYLGLKEVPVHNQDFESAEQEVAFGISDNAIASWAELDLEGINTDVAAMDPNFNIDLLGIKDFVIEPVDKQWDEDAVPETPKEATTHVGELFLLGDHRLLCGDSTDKAQVERLMNGEKADMVFTDPPYGIGYDESRYANTDGYKWKSGNSAVTNKRDVIDGDNIKFDPSSIFEIFGKTKEMFIWGANNFCQKLPENGSWICWEKKTENQASGLGGDFELAWSKQRHKYKMIRKLWGGFLNKERSEGIRFHPTQKPIDLVTQCFDLWGKDASIIWDGYLGSGSTLIACEKTNRKCYGMEIDPLYCDVIISRWEKYTGGKAIKTN